MDKKSSVDPSLVPYLRQADATFQNGFDDDQMRTLFIDNVFEEIKGYEIKLSVMKSSSFIIEQFVEAASASTTLQLIKAFSEDFEDVSTSQQGCHVVQKILQRVVFLNTEVPEETWCDMCNALLNGTSSLKKSTVLAQWMNHTYATHVTRSLFETLGGIVLLNQKQTSHSKTGELHEDVKLAKDQLPKSFLLRLKKIVASFCKLSNQNVAEILTNSSGAPCVCTLVRTVGRVLPKTLKKLCKKIVEVGGNENNNTLLVLAKDKMGSRVLETVLNHSDEASFERLRVAFSDDQEKLIQLASHPVANFVVQKLLSASRMKNTFSDVFSVLCAGIKELYTSRKFGVIQKLAEQCVEMSSCQTKFVDTLAATLGCDGEDKKKLFVPLVASWTPHADFTKNCDLDQVPQLKHIAYHGSLLLQTLLQFKNPRLVFQSLLAIPASHSIALACHVSGSHVIDAFITSECVKSRTKKQWIELMKDVFHEIACNKYGSRVMDTIWKNAALDVKNSIAEEMIKHEEALLADQFGKHLHRNMGLKQFRHRRNDWNDYQQRQARKRKEFSEIIDGSKSKRSR